MPRPKVLKKGRNIKHPPNFEAISKRHPLPMTEYHGKPFPALTFLQNNLYTNSIGHQSMHLADSLSTNFLGPAIVQPSTLLLIQMQHAMNAKTEAIVCLSRS